MEIERIFSVYFSPCGNVKKIANAIADGALGAGGGMPASYEQIDFTLPAKREGHYDFKEGDLVIFGTPVFAGRIPNKMLPFVQQGFTGNGAVAIAVCSYGNRSIDNCLSEIVGELKNNGFIPVGALSVPSQHSFNDKLATLRPNSRDMEELSEYGKKKALELLKIDTPSCLDENKIPGEFPAPAYYTPLQKDGSPAKFLKAVPQTNMDKCTNCGVCARACPMGVIDPADNKTITGACIKCHACVNKCTKGAKYFDDPQLLSHIDMLVDNYAALERDIEFFA